jgi:formylglycine-generating enzyme required for sulfatase activity
MEDYYRVLGLPQDATTEQIKARYRVLVSMKHPDNFSKPEQRAIAEEEMKAINAAYAVLSHPAERSAYDRQYAAYTARAGPPRPVVSPETLDFGMLRKGKSTTARFVVTNSGGKPAEVNFNYSNDDAWYRIASVRQSHSDTAPFPLEVEVAADASKLAEGETYTEWIDVDLDGAKTRVHLRVSVPAAVSEIPSNPAVPLFSPVDPRMLRRLFLVGAGAIGGLVLFVLIGALSSNPGLFTRLPSTPESSPTLEPLPIPKSSLVLNFSPSKTIGLVRVPAGEFLMGSDPAKDGNADIDEQPQHRVYVSEFYIGQHEVTNAQYAVFARDTGRAFQIPPGKDNHPVVNVSWNDAVEFCNWLSKQTGKTIRLPTEAEWEKAARGTGGWIYPWGDQFDPSKLNGFEGGVNDVTPIGKYSPAGDSPYGAADMAGNVLEWTSDWYDGRMYQTRVGLTLPVRDPQGPPSGTYRVLRGGAFSYNQEFVRCAPRFREPPVNFHDNVGFRVVVSP